MHAHRASRHADRCTVSVDRAVPSADRTMLSADRAVPTAACSVLYDDKTVLTTHYPAATGLYASPPAGHVAAFGDLIVVFVHTAAMRRAPGCAFRRLFIGARRPGCDVPRLASRPRAPVERCTRTCLH